MDFYIKEGDIHKELEKRKSDKDLVRRVEEYLGDKLPEPFNDQNKNFAVLFRHIFTPDYEIEKFLEKAKRLNLEPVLIEYKEDKFVAENDDKYALGKLYFYRGHGKNNEIIMDAFKIIDFDDSVRKKIVDVKTIWGELLTEFHHRILFFYYPELEKKIFDYSNWLHFHGGLAKNYYYNFLALFISNAILFDNFRDEGKEGEFCMDIFAPALDCVKNNFGLNPMIIPIQEIEDENNPKWWGYDLSKKEKIIELTKFYKKVE